MIACLYLVLCCNLIASSFCMLKKSSVKWTNACTGYMMASQSGRFSTTQSYVFLKENYRYYLNWFRYLHITVNSLLTDTSLKLTLTLDLIYLRLYFIYYYKTLSKMGICENVINIICQCKFSFANVNSHSLSVGKKRRLTIIECGNDMNMMIDIAKIADLVRVPTIYSIHCLST